MLARLLSKANQCKGIFYTAVALLLCSTTLLSFLSLFSPDSSAMQATQQYLSLSDMYLRSENCLIELSRQILFEISSQLTRPFYLTAHAQFLRIPSSGFSTSIVKDGVRCKAVVISINIGPSTRGLSNMDRLLGVHPENGSIEIVVRGFLRTESLGATPFPSLSKAFTLIIHHPFRYYAAEALAKRAVNLFKGKLCTLLARQALVENASIDSRSVSSLARTLAREASSSLNSCVQDLHIDLSVRTAGVIGNTCFVLLDITVKDLHYASSLMNQVYPIPHVTFEKLLAIDLQLAQRQFG